MRLALLALGMAACVTPAPADDAPPPIARGPLVGAFSAETALDSSTTTFRLSAADLSVGCTATALDAADVEIDGVGVLDLSEDVAAEQDGPVYGVSVVATAPGYVMNAYAAGDQISATLSAPDAFTATFSAGAVGESATVTWTPSGEPGVGVSVHVAGPAGQQVYSAVGFEDSGALSIPGDSFAAAGAYTATVSRYRQAVWDVPDHSAVTGGCPGWWISALDRSLRVDVEP
jgi:hypothetical protein